MAGEVQQNWLVPNSMKDPATDNPFLDEVMKYKYAFGIPPSYSSAVDPEYLPIGGFGRTYYQTILSAPTILSICPGTVKYLPRMAKKYKENFFATISAMANGDQSVIQKINQDKTGIGGQLYEFKSAYSKLMQTVNILIRTCAVCMGLKDVKVPGSNITYGKFDWGFYNRPSEASVGTGPVGIVTDIAKQFQNLVGDNINDQTYIHFFVNGEGTSPSESITTETRSSGMESLINGTVSDVSRDIEFLLGGAMNGKATQAIDELINSVGGEDSMLRDILATGKNYLSGSRLVFPQMLGDVTYGKSLQVGAKFISPSGDKEDILRYVYVPYMFLLALSLPQQVTANMYTYPFLCKTFMKGLYDSDLAAITNLDINRGGSDDTSWTVDGLPTEISCTFSITPLYTKMMTSSTAHPLMFMENTPLIQYLAAISGVEMKKNNWKIKCEIAQMSFLNVVPDFTTNIPRKLLDSNTFNVARKIFNL